MKNYRDIANDIFERREACIAVQKARRKKRLRFTALFGLMLLVVLAGIGGRRHHHPPLNGPAPSDSGENTTVATVTTTTTASKKDDAESRYKDVSVCVESAAIVWPWEYLTVSEQYCYVTIDGTEYMGTGRAVSQTLVGDTLGTYMVYGYDAYNDRQAHTAAFAVYRLHDIAENRFVAVKMEGVYYVFRNNTYTPPSTLGELMAQVPLSQVIELGRFSENGDGADNTHFILADDAYIWDVFEDCATAAFVEDPSFTVGDRHYLSFTVTSEALGVYKVALYVTQDGYLWTNAFSYQYLFDIGEDAAERILTYAKTHSAQTDYEPYNRSIAGTVVAVTDEYLSVDDSILCRDPADGITYRVLLNDRRVTRYVDYGLIHVGDTVQITYEGDVDETYTITTALTMSEASIMNGDILVYG